MFDPTILGAGGARGAGLASPSAPEALDPEREAELRGVAQEFEAVFLTEMLKAAKIGEQGGPFAGGPGEQAFVSLLQREYANALTEQNAIGLAEHIYAQLRQRDAADAE